MMSAPNAPTTQGPSRFKVLLVGQPEELSGLTKAPKSLFEELGIETQSTLDVLTALKTIDQWHPDGILISWSTVTSTLPEAMVILREKMGDSGLVALAPDEESGSKTFWQGADDFLLPSETNWRAARRALRSSQLQRRFMHDANRQRAMLSLALDVAHAGDWSFEITISPSGEILFPDTAYFSPEMKGLLGYQPDEFPNSISAWKQRMEPRFRLEHLTEAYSHVYGSTSYYQQEYRIQHKDGRWLWLLSRGRIIRDSQGVPIRWMGIVMDITSIHDANEGITRYSETAAALVRYSPVAVYLFTRDAHIVMVNEAGAKRFHSTPQELVGLSLWDLLPPDLVEVRKKALAEVLETGQPRRHVDTRLGIPMQSIVFAIPDGDGAFPCFGVIVSDLSTT